MNEKMKGVSIQKLRSVFRRGGPPCPPKKGQPQGAAPTLDRRRRVVTINALLFSLLASALAACSVEGKNDYGSYYQKQGSLSVLKMPPGVNTQGADNYYVVPPGPMADVKTISILPPGSRAYQSAVDKNVKAGITTPAVSNNTANNAAGTS